MKTFIVYSAGGLSNRIFPIASAINFCNKTGRKLLVYWPLDIRCNGRFQDLYDDNIEFIDDEFLYKLSDLDTEYRAVFYESVTNDKNIYNRDFLYKKMEDRVLLIGDSPSIDNSIKNIVFNTNSFFLFNDVSNFDIVKNLKIKNKIVDKAEFLAKEMELGKNVLGIHMRGTDFNANPNEYINIIKQNLNYDKIFICSDDEYLENVVANNFDSKIIKRVGKNYVTKNQNSNDWSNNVFTNLLSLEDALVDILLLAKTNFKIYNTNSSFSKYVKIMNGNYDE